MWMMVMMFIVLKTINKAKTIVFSDAITKILRKKNKKNLTIPKFYFDISLEFALRELLNIIAFPNESK